MINRFIVHAIVQVLPSILQFEHPADATLARYFKENPKLGARDRAFISASIFSIIRNRCLLDFLLAQTPDKPVAAEKIRRMTVLEVAGVQQSSGITTQENTVNALQATVTKCLAQVTEEDLPWLQAIQQKLVNMAPSAIPDNTRHNLPNWLAEKLQAQFGTDEFWTLIHALRQPAPLDLRINILKTKRDAAQQALAAEGFESDLTEFSPWGLRLHSKPYLQKSKAYADGLIEIQDEGSQLLCLLSNAKRNETVVDFCAGAGGKTLAMGAMMRNTGRLYALDASASRLEGLKPRLQRSGLSNVHTLAINHEHDARLQRLWGKVDRVLVDAPCSGLGTLRRHPDLAWRQTPASLAQLQKTQLSILESAAKLLKPGGTLIYATCSLLQEENEGLVHAFEQASAGFSPQPMSKLLKNNDLSTQQIAVSAAHHFKLLPQQQNTDGFFAAAWIRE